jgi:peptidoglycan-N-acetylglucosamine deacetylase
MSGDDRVNGLENIAAPKAAVRPSQRSRRVLLGSALLIMLTSLLVLAGHDMKPPRFMLDPTTQNAVTPIASFSWQQASDWLAGRKYAVLTFDDGPYGHGVDERILNVLRRHHAHAIFFVICSQLNDTTSHLLDSFEQDGHIVGNHSYDHLQLSRLPSLDLRQQIEGCSQRIASVTGHRPYYFRPPYGQTSPQVKRFAELSGMRQMLWNANSQDTWQKKPEQILYWSKTETDNLSILLMHDKPQTAAALDQTLTELERRGFQFVLPEQVPPNSYID